MKQKIHALDLLRGALSMMVVIPHAWQVFVAPYQDANIFFGIVARSAVLLFFCLSGFVISMSIDSNRKKGRFDVLIFASARISRIVPPLIGSMLLVFLLAWILQSLDANTTTLTGAARTRFVSNIASQGGALFTLGTSGNMTGSVNGPLWTLAYEIKLYAISGLLAVVIWGGNFSRLLSLFALWNLIIGDQNLTFQGLPFTVVEKLFFVAFGLGGAMYWLKPRTRFLVGCLLASIAALGITLPLALEFSIAQLDVLQSWIWFQCNVVAIGAFLVALMARCTIETRSNIGDWSYSLYIFHFPLLLFLWMLIEHYSPDFSNLARYPLMILSIAFVLPACALIGVPLERFRMSISIDKAKTKS